MILIANVTREKEREVREKERERGLTHRERGSERERERGHTEREREGVIERGREREAIVQYIPHARNLRHVGTSFRYRDNSVHFWIGIFIAIYKENYRVYCCM